MSWLSRMPSSATSSFKRVAARVDGALKKASSKSGSAEDLRIFQKGRRPSRMR